MPASLIVLGVGPKAVAVCAKAAVLAELGLPTPDLIFIEQHRVGANWCGEHGYTHRDIFLCTLAEKDVGFPYCSECWNEHNSAVDTAMLRFSWTTFLVEKGQYATWVDRGRRSPSHQVFVEYLGWVAEKSRLSAHLHTAEVIEIDIRAGKWLLTCRAEGDQATTDVVGDGLLITGHGDPLLIDNQPAEHPRVFDGRSFWKRDHEWEGRRKSVAVVGAGQTAATIAMALVAELDSTSVITVVNPYGVFYSRGESYTENRLYSSPSDWQKLTADHRRELIKRSDRGVFSLQSQQIIDRASNIVLRPGKASNISCNDNDVDLTIRYDGQDEVVAYDYVVSAIGFSPISFVKLFRRNAVNMLNQLIRPRTVEELLQQPESAREVCRIISETITNDLSVEGFAPKLHVPMLASFCQGPGFPNLTCLGLLSDRVLPPYLQ